MLPSPGVVMVTDKPKHSHRVVSDLISNINGFLLIDHHSSSSLLIQSFVLLDFVFSKDIILKSSCVKYYQKRTVTGCRLSG